MTKLFIILIVVALPALVKAEGDLIVVRISLDEATKEILKEGDRRVLGAATEIIDGKEVHVIKVLTPDGHIQHYKVDAETGKQISS